MTDPWAEWNAANGRVDHAKFYSKDGTLVYDVGYYVIEEQHTDIWKVRLEESQAEQVRTTLKTLADEGILGWIKCEPRIVFLDDLGELGDRLRSLVKEGGKRVTSRPGRADPEPEDLDT